MRSALPLVALVSGLFGCSSSPTTSIPEPKLDPAPVPTLEEHVRFMSEISPSRDWTHLESLDRVAAYIGDHLKRAGARVEVQEYLVEGRAYRNVRAELGPRKGARIVIGAHYDVDGELPGADDNASGCAALLEVARRLGQEELSTTVEFVAYSLEEPPFFSTQHMGSAVHANGLVESGQEVVAMICLEMVGYFVDEPDSQEFPVEAMKALYPNEGNFITVVGRPADAELVGQIRDVMAETAPLPVVALVAPTMVTGVDFSDHRNYWAAGYSAVMITDTSFYRNPNYHTAEDTPDTLDYERMEQVVEGVVAAVLALAG